MAFSQNSLFYFLFPSSCCLLFLLQCFRRVALQKVAKVKSCLTPAFKCSFIFLSRAYCLTPKTSVELVLFSFIFLVSLPPSNVGANENR